MSYLQSMMDKMESNKKLYGSRYAHFFPKYLSEKELGEIRRRFMVIRMPDVQGMYMAC